MRPSEKHPPPAAPDSLSIQLGDWFKAHATGRGVIAIPVVIVVVAAAGILRTLVG
jgi:hypothetical protein